MTIFFLTLALALPPPIHLKPDEPFQIEDIPLFENAPLIKEAASLQKANQHTEALKLLTPLTSPSAALLRARTYRAQGDHHKVLPQLRLAAQDPALSPLLPREHALLAIGEGAVSRALKAFEGVLSSPYPKKSDVGRALARLLSKKSPKQLLNHFDTLYSLTRETHHQSLLLKLKSEALLKEGKKRAAHDLIRKQLREHPLGFSSPKTPPKGVSLSPRDRLDWAEGLLTNHQNQPAINALFPILTKDLNPAGLCRYFFIAGVAHRKLHHYKKAETRLQKAVRLCADLNTRRRAHFLLAKVISIQNGLRSVPVIEEFVDNFSSHTMADDVLFWAGDTFQRLNRNKEAIAYYKRAESFKGDMCSESKWRRAWMAYRSDELKTAHRAFSQLLEKNGCAGKPEDQARAHYWLGKIKEREKQTIAALNHYRQTTEVNPLGFYAQMATSRLKALNQVAFNKFTQSLPDPTRPRFSGICPGELLQRPELSNSVNLIARGLESDATSFLLQLKEHSKDLPVPPAPCPQIEPGILNALLLDRAGAKPQAQWMLRTTFAHFLQRSPTPEQLAILLAAYPLAYRAELAAAEDEHQIPSLLLQSIAREESAFNPGVVSWAGAYGLTQLLFGVGRSVATGLTPPIQIKSSNQLLDPGLNARLGGALLSSLLNRYQGHKGLSLAAYNGSVRRGNRWWKEHQGGDFDVFSEELTIRETRHYVKRVLKTYGIYRWLYQNTPPLLDVNPIPPRKS